MLLCPAVPLSVTVPLLWCSPFSVSLIWCQQKHAEWCPTVSWKLGSCSAMSVVFNPRYTCSKTKFKYKYHVLEVWAGIALLDPKLQLSGTTSSTSRGAIIQRVHFFCTIKWSVVGLCMYDGFLVTPFPYLMQCEFAAVALAQIPQSPARQGTWVMNIGFVCLILLLINVAEEFG